MRLHDVHQREDFDTYLQEEAGYHSWGGYSYIEPDHIAQITTAQSDFLKRVCEEMYTMCLAAVDKVISEGRFAEFGVSPEQAKHIISSWQRHQELPVEQRHDPELYGRFDFCWDGGSNIKFYEINADTPTTAYECSVVQWVVMRDLAKSGQIPADAGQLNDLENQVVKRFESIRAVAAKSGIDTMHFTCMTDWKEDLTTTLYLEALAQKAGWKTIFTDINLIGADENIDSPGFGTLYDEDGGVIRAMYKLMPLEHLYESPYAPYICRDDIFLVEPAWKAIMSNKMLAVILWEMYPDHPYLLKSTTDPTPFNGTYVEKPIFGRISAGVKVVKNNVIISSKRLDPDEPVGPYGRYPKVYQEFCPLPEMPGLRGWLYLTGLWVVGPGVCAGMDIRIDRALVTGGANVRFLPHFVSDE